MLCLNSLPSEGNISRFSHSSSLLWTTPYAFDETQCPPSPVSPPSHFFNLSPGDDSGLSSPSSPLSSSDSSPSALPFSDSLAPSLQWSFFPHGLTRTDEADGSDPASPPLANLVTPITAVQCLIPSVPSSVHKESLHPLELLENRPILPFILKLWSMVRDPSSAGLIFWSRDGLSLVVLDECSVVPCLEKHYRQRNFVSFVRQLHCHGFTKKSMSTTAVGLRQEREGTSNPGEDAGHCITFTHPSCRRDREDLLPLILSKRSVKRSAAGDDLAAQSIAGNARKQRTDEAAVNNVVISDLYAQARQLFVQHEQLTYSQSSILLRLQGMMRDLDDQSPPGEEAAAERTDGRQPSALKKRKRNVDSNHGTV